MGGLSLTNPGLVYQDPTIDPMTGQPVVKPRVSFFPNNAARALAFAKQQESAVSPSTSDISGQLALPGEPSNNVPSTIPAATPSIPKFFKPSFTSTLTDPSTGLPAPVNPAQTKLGKLLTVIGAAARGGLAGWGYGNPAQGAQAAREIPFQQVEQRAELAQRQAQTSLTQSQASMVQTPYGPMPLGMARYIFPSLIRGQATTQAATIGANSRENVADTNAASRENVAQINKRFLAGPNGLYDTQTRTLIPETAAGIPVTPEIAKDYGLPQEFVGKPLRLSTLTALENTASKYAPNVTSESSSTDLMGSTSTKRTTQKVRPGQTAAPGALPAPLVQNVPGGPLVRQNPPGPAPRLAATNAPTPAAAAATPAPAPTKSTAAPDTTLQLAPDVEQRLASSGLTGQQQAYVRGLLAYRGQMPSPRAKNYAQTLAVLTQIDPGFDAPNYDARRKTALDYTPGGSQGKQATSFNTAIAHLGMLSDAGDALHNNNVQLLNRVANFFGVQLGKNPVTTFNNIADAVDGEVAKTFKGTATEGELSRVGAHFNSALGPDQIDNNIRSTVGLLNGKMGEMQSAYLRQMNRPIDLVSPEAKQTLQRIAARTNGGQPGAHQVGDLIVQGGHTFKVTKVDPNGKPTAADPQ